MLLTDRLPLHIPSCVITSGEHLSEQGRKTSRQTEESVGQREILSFFIEANHSTALLCSGSVVSLRTGILGLSDASISEGENSNQIFSGGGTIGVRLFLHGFPGGL